MKTVMVCDHCGDHIDSLDLAMFRITVYSPIMADRGTGQFDLCGPCSFPFSQFLAPALPGTPEQLAEDYRKKLNDAIAEEKAVQGLRGRAQSN